MLLDIALDVAPVPVRSDGSSLDFNDVLVACPGSQDALTGLRHGGWLLDSARPEASDPRLLSVTCSKNFRHSTPIHACENARSCGVSDELGPVFDWTPDRGSDDDGPWDCWDGEL